MALQPRYGVRASGDCFQVPGGGVVVGRFYELGGNAATADFRRYNRVSDVQSAMMNGVGRIGGQSVDDGFECLFFGVVCDGVHRFWVF